MSSGFLAQIIRTICPLMIKASFSASTATVPSNAPCTESFLRRAARFIKSASALLRVTIPLNLNCCPLPACFISSLAAKRPILPKPYKTTSLGSNSTAFEDSNPANLFLRKSDFESKFACSLSHSEANFPISNLAGARSIFKMS